MTPLNRLLFVGLIAMWAAISWFVHVNVMRPRLVGAALLVGALASAALVAWRTR